MMKILVTGACGFIGREIVRRLALQGGLDVVGIYRNGTPEFGLSRVRWIKCDIVSGIHLKEEFDYIIHCAALQDAKNYPVRAFIDTNLAMTENVAAFGVTAGIKGVLFTSSVRVYGSVLGKFVDERCVSVNPSHYGISKYLCECLLQEYVDRFPVIALRLCGVVGPGAKNIWLSNVLDKALKGEDIEIYNAEHGFNNIIHTDDLTDFFFMLMSNGFSGFNAFPVASEKSVSVRRVVEEILTLTNSSSQIIEKGETGSAFMISNRMPMEKFGYVPSDVIVSLKKYMCNTGI